MRRLFTFVLGLLGGCAGMYVAYEYHVVRAADSFHLVRKMGPTRADWYVDVRGWKPAEWSRHRELAEALTKQGKGDLVKPPASQGLLPEWFPNFRSGQADDPDAKLR